MHAALPIPFTQVPYHIKIYFLYIFYISQGLKTGDIAMVIGTHSLIADKTDFSALRFSVIDEQQRFGVVQRGRFNSKVNC